MTDVVTGGCLCGGVRFEVRGPFIRAGHCHCSRCRRHSGTTGLMQARVRREHFHLLRGAELVRVYGRGEGAVKAFCWVCGSSLFGGTWPEGPQVSIRMGAFDGDPGIRLQFHTFVDSKAPWDEINDGLPRHPGEWRRDAPEGASHRDLIVDQFTKQALPFSTAPGIRDEEALGLLVEASGAGPDDTVLDVACGPGHVVCAFARVVRQATGIDVTPAMLERGRALAAARGLANVAWHLSDVLPLPFPDAAFSIVVSRFAFHHFPDPLAVLREMRRVAAPGGRVVVADLTAAPDPARAAAFHRMEVLRDPSHVRALTRADLEALFAAAGLVVAGERRYRLEADLDDVLSRSFPAPGDEARIRAMWEAALADDGFGLGARREGERIRFAYPVVVLVSRPEPVGVARDAAR